MNIEDVYETDLFDFSGPKKFDQATGYETKSMLVCPLISRKKKVVGVLQLINAQNDEGGLIPFDKAYESIIESLASQAGLSIENMEYVQEIRDLFESFVKVVAKTIDERTPYNKMHSENLSIRIKDFALHLNTLTTGPYKDLYFDDAHIYKLVTAAWLHDIGKIVVPIEVLDKPNRLDQKYELMMSRYAIIEAKIERNYYKDVAEQGYSEKRKLRFDEEIARLHEIRLFVTEINHPSTYVDDEKLDRLETLHHGYFPDMNEVFMTADEFECLSIRKGTLTAEERESVQEHISAGARILSELEFPEYLDNIYEWIINHHEYLDGSGYARGLKAEQIDVESRMMTILDIFDSLVQSNRPYKKAFARDKAVSILQAMAEEGKLDKDLVKVFAESDLWK